LVCDKLWLTIRSFRKDIWDTIGKEMTLPSRAVEDAIWAMGPDEIAQRANHQPFLLERGSSFRHSRSPPSAIAYPAAQISTPTTPNAYGRAGDEGSSKRHRRASSSAHGRRSRTHSTSLAGSASTTLPSLREAAGVTSGHRFVKRETADSEQEHDSGREQCE
jgi:hypothetical protein